MAKILNRTKVYQGVIVNVSKITYALDHTEFEAEVVNHPGGVCIAATQDDNKSFFIVRQFRYGAGKELIEFPAGLIDPNEPPHVSAKRELQEETGYQAQSLESLGKLYLSPGGSDEVIHLYYASNLNYVGQNLDDTESLTVESIAFDTLYAMVIQGEIEDAKTVALTLKLKAIIQG